MPIATVTAAHDLLMDTIALGQQPDAIRGHLYDELAHTSPHCSSSASVT